LPLLFVAAPELVAGAGEVGAREGDLEGAGDGVDPAPCTTGIKLLARTIVSELPKVATTSAATGTISAKPVIASPTMG